MNEVPTYGYHPRETSVCNQRNASRLTALRPSLTLREAWCSQQAGVGAQTVALARRQPGALL